MNQVTIESGLLSVMVSLDSGAVVSLRHRESGLELVALPPVLPPFRIHLRETDIVETFHQFELKRQPEGLRLVWALPHGLSLEGEIEPRGADLVFRGRLANSGSATIERLEYPLLRGIGRLAGPGHDELVHSHATGMLFRDPLDVFEPDPENTRRITRSPYPAGFAGSTMQFVAYLGRGVGGFYLAAEDPGRRFKWFGVAKVDDALELSVGHQPDHAINGTDLAPPYEVAVAAIAAGTWHRAADRYRRWALTHGWAQPRPRASWLREQVGLATFGVNALHNRSTWLDRFHAIAGAPVFHVLGPNWARCGQDYETTLPRGRSDWFFPARFSASNLGAIRRNGDYWAPFEFDLLCVDEEVAAERVLEGRLVHDATHMGQSDPGLLSFPLMCAGTRFWREFHVQRDAQLVAHSRPDAVYYDISVNNLLMECLAAGHDHRAGSGSDVAEAFRSMYDDTNAAMIEAAGRPVPAGTEMMSEAFLGQFDYYQARGEAGPYASFETAAFRDWLLNGHAEKIPLFTYVFGERAPLRLDGWGKLSAASGELFYWVAAQVVLNGGLFELNYEFSPLEDLDGRSDPVAEHYYKFDERHERIDGAKAAFVGQLARVRTGNANPFLANGSMLPAPHVDADPIGLEYSAFNLARHDPLQGASGELTVPSAIASAWELDGQSIWLVANILSSPQEVRVDGKGVRLKAREIATVAP